MTELIFLHPILNYFIQLRTFPVADPTGFQGLSVVAAQTGVYLFGMYRLHRFGGGGHRDGIIAATITALTVIVIYGYSPLWLPIVSLPLAVGASGEFLTKKRVITSLPLAVVSAVILLLVSGPFGVIGILFGGCALLYAFRLAPCSSQILEIPSLPRNASTEIAASACTASARAAGAGSQAASRLPLLLLFWGVIASVAYILSPYYTLPAYPPVARLTPISPLTFIGHPYIGEALVPSPLSYQPYVHECLVQWVSFSILSAFLGMFRWIAPRHSIAMFLGGSILFLPEILVTAPTLFPFTPFQTILRLIPQSSLITLPWLLAPLVISLTLPLLLGSARRISAPFGPGHRGSTAASLILLLLIGSQSRSFFGDIRSITPVSPDQPNHSIEDTPSQLILRDAGSKLISRIGKCRTPLPFDTNTITLLTSPNQEMSSFLVDGQQHTAWRTGAPQRPGQFITLKSSVLLEADGITLNPGASYTDFPRSFEIAARRSDENDFSVISSFADWPGAIRITPEGLPYFGRQDEVSVVFPELQRFNEIRIAVLDSNRPPLPFDWTVTELTLWSIAPCPPKE